MNPIELSLPLPSDWKEYPAKRLFSDKCLKGYPDETPLASSQLFGVIPQELLEKTLDKQVMVATKGFEKFKLVDKDDFVISLRSFQGGIEYSKYRGIISPAYTVLSKSSKVYSGFFIYYLKSDEFLQRINSVITGIREGKTIKYENFALLRLPLPPLEIQKQIADFLDKETIRIDTLISKKQKQIELLKEKRQAVITQSVTKGLDPTVKMKDSGVEWIGEIPEGWEVRKIRFLFSFGRGLGISKSDLKDEGVPCISYGEIHSKYGFEVIPEKHELKCVDEEYLTSSKSSLINNGDFIFADTSEDIEGSGSFSYLKSNEITFAGYHTVIMRPKTEIHSRFIAYLFDSPPQRSQIQQMVKGVKVYSITQSILKDVLVILPSQEEQDMIAQYLDSECIRVDQISEKILKSIDLLKEYRSSLITHAVSGLPVPGATWQTGQIDLTEFTKENIDEL